ncbi:MAG TPA: YpdA family putative bacillithiol disulfide reductase [Gemmatimonadaceae bacterium]|nr:YpdA family putative bacillithiol disulfide reductase [Gemmatimonadaceae bacterium]
MTATSPVVIVGAGPCGLAAAVALEEAGVPSIVFDRSCVVSSIARYPTYLTFFSSPERLEIGDVPFTPAGEKPTRREGLAYYRSVVDWWKLTVRQYEEVTSVERAGTGFAVRSQPVHGEPAVTNACAVVVATGYFASPNMLGVRGEDLPHVSHEFHEGHEAFQRRAVVVGGGNSAVECALELARCGARVTLVHYEAAFSKVIKPWILPEFEERVASGAITMLWSARVASIDPQAVHFNTDTGPVSVPADHVFLLTGYTPSPGLLGELGVPFDPATGIPAHNPATMETPIRGVFVAGVLTSGKKANGVFIENGRGHGALIAAALKGRGPK